MSHSARDNWLSSLNWQMDFCQDSRERTRTDSEFEWKWLEQSKKQGLVATARSILAKVVKPPASGDTSLVTQEWVNKNVVSLWESRNLLADDLSKLLFDSVLVLRCSSYGQYYFPRIDFENFVTIESEVPFQSDDLPTDYLGLPLRVFKLKLEHAHEIPSLTILSTRVQIDLFNSYRQYCVQRNSIDVTPAAGDVVLDCGACIGEISSLFAGLVGVRGQVHLFDPVPLHARYCELQASMNPAIAKILKINILAVGENTHQAEGVQKDATSISPANVSADSFPTTSLDDYVSANNLDQVDFIKMDIEGAEMAAIAGAQNTIRNLKPRLAISSYHKPADLWEIPHRIKELNGDYQLFFGHHSPINWESVHYAV